MLERLGIYIWLWSPTLVGLQFYYVVRRNFGAYTGGLISDEAMSQSGIRIFMLACVLIFFYLLFAIGTLIANRPRWFGLAVLNMFIHFVLIAVAVNHGGPKFFSF